MKSVLILLAGVSIGWIFHLFWSLDDIGRSQSLQTVVTPRDAGLQPSQYARNGVADSLMGVAPGESSAGGGGAQFGNQSNSDTDLGRCSGDQDSYADCREKVVRFAKSHNSRGKVIPQLELWLSDHPDDLQIGLLLVDTLVSDRRFLPAIARLQQIKSYQFEFEAIEILVDKVESLIRSTDRMLHDNNKLDSQVSLYQILIDAEAQNPRWRYELSGILNKAGQYDQALEMLSYILYDAEYGEKATALYQEISQRARSNDQGNIPLVKSGSQFLVEVVINNSVPLTLLIDTGASITSIDKNILARFATKAESSSQGILQTVNGNITATLIMLDSLRVGDFAIRNIEAAGIDSLGDHLDGLLGMDFLGRFKFSIDQESRLLFLGNR